jgi:hypothetical protein
VIVLAKWEIILRTTDGQGYTVERYEDYDEEPTEEQLKEIVVKLRQSVNQELIDRYWND